jgi:hypothetical protein
MGSKLALLGEEPLKVYVAGRIRGVKEFERQFSVASENLRKNGHQVFNPAASNQDGRPLNEIMAYLLPHLCRSDAIAMLPRWWTGLSGAWIEWLLAKYLGLKIIYL